jgi:hypothetical protein
MGTKNNPGQFDCYANAEPDEPMFILLARDPLAPILVRLWAELRAAASLEDDSAMIEEAMELADDMNDWRYTNRPGKRLVLNFREALGNQAGFLGNEAEDVNETPGV